MPESLPTKKFAKHSSRGCSISMGNLWHVGPKKQVFSGFFCRLERTKTANDRQAGGVSSSAARQQQWRSGRRKTFTAASLAKKSRGFTRKSWNVSLTEHFNLHRSRVRVIVLIARRARVETFVMELVCIFNHHRAVGQHALSTMIGQFVAI